MDRSAVSLCGALWLLLVCSCVACPTQPVVSIVVSNTSFPSSPPPSPSAIPVVVIGEQVEFSIVVDLPPGTYSLGVTTVVGHGLRAISILPFWVGNGVLVDGISYSNTGTSTLLLGANTLTASTNCTGARNRFVLKALAVAEALSTSASGIVSSVTVAAASSSVSASTAVRVHSQVGFQVHAAAPADGVEGDSRFDVQMLISHRSDLPAAHNVELFMGFAAPVSMTFGGSPHQVGNLPAFTTVPGTNSIALTWEELQVGQQGTISIPVQVLSTAGLAPGAVLYIYCRLQWYPSSDLTSVYRQEIVKDVQVHVKPGTLGHFRMLSNELGRQAVIAPQEDFSVGLDVDIIQGFNSFQLLFTAADSDLQFNAGSVQPQQPSDVAFTAPPTSTVTASELGNSSLTFSINGATATSGVKLNVVVNCTSRSDVTGAVNIYARVLTDAGASTGTPPTFLNLPVVVAVLQANVTTSVQEAQGGQAVRVSVLLFHDSNSNQDAYTVTVGHLVATSDQSRQALVSDIVVNYQGQPTSTFENTDTVVIPVIHHRRRALLQYTVTLPQSVVAGEMFTVIPTVLYSSARVGQCYPGACSIAQPSPGTVRVQGPQLGDPFLYAVDNVRLPHPVGWQTSPQLVSLPVRYNQPVIVAFRIAFPVATTRGARVIIDLPSDGSALSALERPSGSVVALGSLLHVSRPQSALLSPMLLQPSPSTQMDKDLGDVHNPVGGNSDERNEIVIHIQGTTITEDVARSAGFDTSQPIPWSSSIRVEYLAADGLTKHVVSLPWHLVLRHDAHGTSAGLRSCELDVTSSGSPRTCNMNLTTVGLQADSTFEVMVAPVHGDVHYEHQVLFYTAREGAPCGPDHLQFRLCTPVATDTSQVTCQTYNLTFHVVQCTWYGPTRADTRDVASLSVSLAMGFAGLVFPNAGFFLLEYFQFVADRLLVLIPHTSAYVELATRLRWSKLEMALPWESTWEGDTQTWPSGAVEVGARYTVLYNQAFWLIFGSCLFLSLSFIVGVLGLRFHAVAYLMEAAGVRMGLIAYPCLVTSSILAVVGVGSHGDPLLMILGAIVFVACTYLPVYIHRAQWSEQHHQRKVPYTSSEAASRQQLYHPIDRRRLIALGSMFAAYRPSAHWWMLCVLARKWVYGVILVLALHQPRAQLSLVLILYIVYAAMLVAYRPYVRLHYLLAELVSLALPVTFFVGVELSVVSKTATEAAQNAAEGGAIVVHWITILGMVAVLLPPMKDFAVNLWTAWQPQHKYEEVDRLMKQHVIVDERRLRSAWFVGLAQLDTRSSKKVGSAVEDIDEDDMGGSADSAGGPAMLQLRNVLYTGTMVTRRFRPRIDPRDLSRARMPSDLSLLRANEEELSDEELEMGQWQIQTSNLVRSNSSLAEDSQQFQLHGDDHQLSDSDDSGDDVMGGTAFVPSLFPGSQSTDDAPSVAQHNKRGRMNALPPLRLPSLTKGKSSSVAPLPVADHDDDAAVPKAPSKPKTSPDSNNKGNVTRSRTARLLGMLNKAGSAAAVSVTKGLRLDDDDAAELELDVDDEEEVVLAADDF